MSETLVWWVMVQVVGLAALPLCLILFHRLPDRGYALSKPFALLIAGYIFWILVIVGLPNTTRAIWFALALLAAASAYVAWRRRDELLAFARDHWSLIVATEVLFFLAFITAAYLRSYVPDFGGTEKPMDLMYLNAVTVSDSFPPADPWLAGESVSYYYFGYLLVSLMTRLSGLATSIGYNLGLAMIVAMTVTAAFGLVYNLAAPRERSAQETGPGIPAAGSSKRTLWRPMLFGLVAALLLAVMGNLVGLLELFAAHNVGSAGFWSWVNIPGLSAYDSGSWFPDQFWFWWRATRVLDFGSGIHEMPFFSFLLGDLHPHVMSIPFVLLAVGVAMAFLRSEGPLDLVVWLERPVTLIAFGLILGGLAFLNTWDMPTMAFVVTLAVVLRNRLLTDRWSWGLALDSLGFVVPLYLVAFLAYTPFFFGGFDSQAAGFTAQAGAGSGLFHTFLLWGPFAMLVLPYAVWRLSQSGEGLTRSTAISVFALTVALIALWAVWDLIAWAFGFVPDPVQANEASLGLWDRVTNRGWNWLTVFVIGGSLGLLALALMREVESAREAAEDRLGSILALALAATAALLILGAEFIYIQDGFNSRLNTIFKLYYQAWLLLSIAGGFALYELARGWRVPAINVDRFSIGEFFVLAATGAGAIAGIALASDVLTGIAGAIIGAGILFVYSGAAVLLWQSSGIEPTIVRSLSWRGVWAGGVAAILIAAFVYPVIATYNRTNDFNLPRGLDGLERIPEGEQAAIEWLADHDAGQPVIAEALGNDYTDGGRISAATGLPTLLQWPGHEVQWRGSSEPQEGRREDLELLYTSSDPNAVRSVIERYDIRYVVVGPRERADYPNLTVEESELFELAHPGDVAVYQLRPGVRNEVTNSR
ncbi:MAG: hypothetical protein IH866_00690 [Chloroflexi bacterium]|nr:hypothetical protein [Chloroflexota bacterium]